MRCLLCGLEELSGESAQWRLNRRRGRTATALVCMPTNHVATHLFVIPVWLLQHHHHTTWGDGATPVGDAHQPVASISEGEVHAAQGSSRRQLEPMHLLQEM